MARTAGCPFGRPECTGNHNESQDCSDMTAWHATGCRSCDALQADCIEHAADRALVTYGLPVNPTPEEHAFATFGPEVGAASVPALVRSGVRVWSFGDGDEAGEFTTIDADDLWAWSDDDGAAVVASWAPFRVDAETVR